MHLIDPSEQLSLEKIEKIWRSNELLGLSAEAKKRIGDCRDFLEKMLREAPGEAFYGINTGFGSLASVVVKPQDLARLQENLVKSHATGMGDVVPEDIARLMLFLKIQSLSYGRSAVRVEVVERLIEFWNRKITPVIFELGSLGASGDLAPLAHLSLPILGLGEVFFEGKRQKATPVLKKMGLAPLVLAEKEGLALLNGTQFCLAFSISNLLAAKKMAAAADFLAAVSAEAWLCQKTPFDHRIHDARPHAGQRMVAKNILNWLKDSELGDEKRAALQDPYSFRCVPQVHGASRDAFDFFEKTILIEANSVTDNPNVFAEDGLIVSGGNFHAQPLALAMDFLAVAVSELGNISERRIFQLISGQRGLPPFLAKNAGLNSGLMIAQYTAAAILNQNKGLCWPSSVDSIVSSNGQEDHVSMGAHSATKARRVVENTRKILGIELLTAMQALEMRRKKTGKKSSPQIERVFSDYRKQVAFLENDRILSEDMAKSAAFLANFES